MCCTLSSLMSSENIALVLKAKDDLHVVPVPKPTPGRNEVLIAVHSVGICGSDIHYWKHGRIGDFIVNGPLILGHEASGTIVETGADVKHLKKGDRVAIEPAVPCRKCGFCIRGRYNLCPDIKCCATPPYNGSISRFYVHDADFCFKLPDNVSLEEGALLEPLSVGVHACRRGKIKAGHAVLICGAGPIGLMNMFVAKAMGATQICITDISDSRLKIAKDLGANYTVNVTKKDVKDLAKTIQKLLGRDPDRTIECSGAEASVKLGIEATRPGGTIVIVGMGPPEIKLPIVTAGIKEVDIKGIFRYLNCYPIALSLVASGAVDVKKIITHRFKIANSLEAFELSQSGADGAIKVIIQCREQ